MEPGCCPDNVGSGKLIRVDYIGIVTNSSPVVVLNADPYNGSLPLAVNFSSEGTFDPDGDPLIYEWDFETDGTVDSFEENPSFNYTSLGEFNVQLRVQDNKGAVSVKNVTIFAGNNAATYSFNSPLDGGLYGWNEVITFDLSTTDVEDGNINCTDVNLIPSLGHLNHFHDDLNINTCTKSITLDPLDHDISGEMDIFYVLGVNFTDQGGLTSFDQIKLYPKRMESEFYGSQEGVTKIANNDIWGGGSETIQVNHNSYISYSGRDLFNIDAVRFRTSSASIGGIIELRIDSIDGQLISSVQVPITKNFENWVDFEVPIDDPGGKHDLYFRFINNPGDFNMFHLNWMEFVGAGVSVSNSNPQIESVEAVAPTIVKVVYQDPIDRTTAESIDNYSINHEIDVLGAFLQPDDRTVYLSVSPLSGNVDYILDIAGAMQFPFVYTGCGKVPFPDQWEEHLIDGALPYRSVYILPQQDIDGDGLKDIVTGAWWYKNPGSADGNWVQNVIGSPFNNVAWIYDFDDDGDQDLFGSQGQYESSDLVWAENDGSGSFTIHANLPSGTSSHNEIFIAGIAGGVFQSGGSYQMAITWNGGENGSSQVQMVTVPSDPVNGTWTIESIHPTSLGEALSAGDIDDDGDLDLFQAGNWLRNDAGTWTLFSTGITFNTIFDRSRLSDIDQDGDLDGVAGQIGNNQEVAWFEAPNDPTQTWTKHTLDPLIDGTLSLGVADMDFDGDEDVIVGEFQGAHKLFGFENDLNNSGSWIKHIIDDGGPLDHHDGSQLVDIDNDGDLDIMTLGWFQIIPRIFENKSLSSNCSPILINPGNQQYQERDMVSLQILASDPNPGDVLSYSVIGLPPSLSMDPMTGLISGTITTSTGDFAVVVSVTDGVQTSKETFLIQIGVVTDIPDQPNISNLKLFPNPAVNQATLEVYLNSSEEIGIEIFDLLGKKYDFGTAQFRSGKNLKTLDLRSIDGGVYYLKLISRSSRNEGVRIVVRK